MLEKMNLLLLLGSLIRGSKELDDFLILDFLIRLDLNSIETGVGGHDVTVLGDKKGGHILSDNGVVTFVHDVVREDGLVLGGFDNTHAGLALILKITEREGERAGLGLDLGEDGAGSGHLELVTDTSLLVDGGTCLQGTDLTLTGGDEDINGIHLVLGKLNALEITQVKIGGVQDDLLLAIGLILELVVGQHTLNGLDVVSFSNLVNSLGDLHVLVTGTDHTDSGLKGGTGGLDDIGLGASDGTIGTNNNGSGNSGTVTIDLSTQLAFIKMDL